MALYDSYLDEDVDFDESFAEYLDEDLGEAEDFDEARRSYRGGRRGNRRGGGRRPLGAGSRRPNAGGGRALTGGAVRTAFRDVSTDVKRVQSNIARTQTSGYNQNLLEIIALLVAAPKLTTTKLVTPIEIVNPDGTKGQLNEITTGINNNLLIPLAIKLLAGTRGGGRQNNNHLLLLGLGALVLFPDIFKDLGLNLGNQPRNTNSTTVGNTALGLDVNTLAKGGLIYLLARNQNQN